MHLSLLGCCSKNVLQRPVRCLIVSIPQQHCSQIDCAVLACPCGSHDSGSCWRVPHPQQIISTFPLMIAEDTMKNCLYVHWLCCMLQNGFVHVPSFSTNLHGSVLCTFHPIHVLGFITADEYQIWHLTEANDSAGHSQSSFPHPRTSHSQISSAPVIPPYSLTSYALCLALL